MEIKFCGLRQIGLSIPPIHYVGINFVKTSTRYVSSYIENQFLDDLITSVDAAKALAIVQNPGQDTIFRLATLQIQGIQFHGNESPGYISEIKRYFADRVQSFITVKALSYLEREKYEKYLSIVDFLVFDAPRPGSGISYDYRLLQSIPHNVPFFVSGGLGIHNISYVLEFVPHAKGIDIATGIEASSAGSTVRDTQKMRQIYYMIMNQEKYVI